MDDNATNRKILAQQAKSWGMQFCSTDSGTKAIDLIKQEKDFDLAILDMQMPEMDGITLALEIRQLQKCQDFPLILLSSIDKLPESEEMIQANFSRCLQKPIKQADLLQVLLQVLIGQRITVKPTELIQQQISSDLGENHPLKILLAEDNGVNQQLALKLLEKMGYRADMVGNGLEAIEALKRQSYDVILMDVQMPEMDGITATEHICAEYLPEARPHIIALTANAIQGDRERCLAAGMSDYVSKPIKVDELARVLQSCQPVNNKSVTDASGDDDSILPNVPIRSDVLIEGDKLPSDKEMTNNSDYKPLDVITPSASTADETIVNTITAMTDSRKYKKLLDSDRAELTEDSIANKFNQEETPKSLIDELQDRSINKDEKVSHILVKKESTQHTLQSDSTEQVLDIPFLKNLLSALGTDVKEILIKLAEIYFSETQELLQTLDVARKNQDTAGIEAAAHTLKSSSHSLGGVSLAELCQQVERLSRDGQTSQAISLSDRLESEYRNFKVALEKFISSL